MDTFFSVIEMVARAGGGGSSSGGGGVGGLLSIPVIIVLVIWTWWKRKQRIKKAKEDLGVAAATDPTWNDELIKARVSDVFARFQNDWSLMNAEAMKKYTMPRYQHHMALILHALQLMRRTNTMQNIELNGLALVEVQDFANDEDDSFTIEVSARADDSLVDTVSNEVIYSDNKPFVEYWTFEREKDEWLLRHISQSTSKSLGTVLGKDIKVTEDAFEQIGLGRKQGSFGVFDKSMASILFAQKNKFYYNADFGWLLMPQGGTLFSGSNFKTSDINDHVIGVYKNVLVQFFEYIPVSPQAKVGIIKHLTWYRRTGSSRPTYVVAAATLPKKYGNIIVQRKRIFSWFKPVGMFKVQTEWRDFNKKYHVLASDMDRVNSLELLHPGYMEQLERLGFQVNIEIADNVLYLHTTDHEKADFDQMLVLLQAAFEEMKM